MPGISNPDIIMAAKQINDDRLVTSIAMESEWNGHVWLVRGRHVVPVRPRGGGWGVARSGWTVH